MLSFCWDFLKCDCLTSLGSLGPAQWVPWKKRVKFSVKNQKMFSFCSVCTLFFHRGIEGLQNHQKGGMKKFIFTWGVKVELKGGITIVGSVFTFLTESSFSSRISIVFCLNVLLSKQLFEIIILIVFSMLFSLRYFLFTFYLQPN